MDDQDKKMVQLSLDLSANIGKRSYDEVALMLAENWRAAVCDIAQDALDYINELELDNDTLSKEIEKQKELVKGLSGSMNLLEAQLNEASINNSKSLRAYLEHKKLAEEWETKCGNADRRIVELEQQLAELNKKKSLHRAKWHKVSNPPSTNRNVRLKLKDGSIRYGWFGGIGGEDVLRLFAESFEESAKPDLSHTPHGYIADAKIFDISKVSGWQEVFE